MIHTCTQIAEKNPNTLDSLKFFHVESFRFRKTPLASRLNLLNNLAASVYNGLQTFSVIRKELFAGRLDRLALHNSDHGVVENRIRARDVLIVLEFLQHQRFNGPKQHRVH